MTQPEPNVVKASSGRTSRPPRQAARVHPSGRRTGFTLVEILTATAIMATLVAVVLTVLSQVSDSWTRSSEEVTMGHQAQTALNIIQRDLQSAILKRDGHQWLALIGDDLVQEEKQSRILFFAPTTLREVKDSKTSDDLFGEVCAIEYRVRYASPFDATETERANGIFTLHRAVINPRSTMKGWDKNNPLLGSDDLLTTWEKIDTEGSNSETIDGIKVYGGTKISSTLADNVAKFEIKLFYYSKNPDQPNQTTLVLPSQSTEITVPAGNPNYPLTAAYLGGKSSIIDGLVQGVSTGNLLAPSVKGFAGLAYADVTLIILNEEGAELFAQSNLQNLKTDQFLQKYGKTYTERVYFPNRLQ